MRLGQLVLRLAAERRPGSVAQRNNLTCARALRQVPTMAPARPAFGPLRAFSAPQPRKRRRQVEANGWQCASISPAPAGIAAFLKARLLRGRSEGPHAGHAGGRTRRINREGEAKSPAMWRERRELALCFQYGKIHGLLKSSANCKQFRYRRQLAPKGSNAKAARRGGCIT